MLKENRKTYQSLSILKDKDLKNCTEAPEYIKDMTRSYPFLAKVLVFVTRQTHHSFLGASFVGSKRGWATRHSKVKNLLQGNIIDLCIPV